MADDKKTLKFQMMMSPSEADELDDWMFQNRIRSRAEAIRRLCQIGLSFDRFRRSYATDVKTAWEELEGVDIGSEPDEHRPKISSQMLASLMVTTVMAIRYAGDTSLEDLIAHDARLRELVQETEGDDGSS